MTEQRRIEDVRALAAMLAELPSAALVATCERETDRGIEGQGKRVETLPTSLIVRARGELLGAWDTWRRVVGLPGRAKRGPDAALRARALSPGGELAAALLRAEEASK